MSTTNADTGALHFTEIHAGDRVTADVKTYRDGNISYRRITITVDRDPWLSMNGQSLILSTGRDVTAVHPYTVRRA